MRAAAADFADIFKALVECGIDADVAQAWQEAPLL
jgi:hypothetical protein